MAREALSPGVREFIQRVITSVEKLEVLLFLMSNSELAWSANEASERLRLGAAEVASSMQELHTAKILTKGPDEKFRYAPTSTALEREVAESLNKAYRERRSSILQLIYSRPLENIRILADAFRIKEREE